MKKFDYKRAESFEEAGRIQKKNAGVSLLAGGTDLLGVLKADILPEYPNTVVDLKRIPEASGIKEDDGVLRIGALTTLLDIETSELIKEKAPILSEAASVVVSPIIRSAATVGGNICQDVRCWFYRYPHEAAGCLNCARKGGDQCYAIQGDNRYHSIFGGMKTGTTPCTVKCPAATDIPGYMAKIRKNDWDGAIEILMQVNPMPMCTSRICPHVCQDGCNQCEHGDCVSIHSVERKMGDIILANLDKYYKAPLKETGKKVAVVGAGPAGLTAAYFLRKSGHDVTVYDKMEEAGGVLMYGIPAYRLPKDIVRAFAAALEGMGIKFMMNTVIGQDITVDKLREENDSVFLGTGAWKQPLLGLDGENFTQFGLNFLVEVNKYLKGKVGKEVLVCGGGNVAMDVALVSKRLGVEKVTLVCLEQRNEMPASEEEVARALEEGVEIINGRGLIPTTIICVMQEETKNEVMILAGLTKHYPLDVKFAKVRPIRWCHEAVPYSKEEALKRMKISYPDLESVGEDELSDGTEFYKSAELKGRIGIMRDGKNVLHVSNTGKLSRGFGEVDYCDLMPLLRGNGTKAEIKAAMRTFILN